MSFHGVEGEVVKFKASVRFMIMQPQLSSLIRTVTYKTCPESHLIATSSEQSVNYELPVTPTLVRSRTRQMQQESGERYLDFMHCLERPDGGRAASSLDQPIQSLRCDGGVVGKGLGDSNGTSPGQVRNSRLTSLFRTSTAISDSMAIGKGLNMGCLMDEGEKYKPLLRSVNNHGSLLYGRGGLMHNKSGRSDTRSPVTR